MAIVVNNTDQLTFILTSYGLNRVAEALANPQVDLNLSKIKVGDANGEFYEPTEQQTELVHEIPEGSFYIVDKDLLEDGITISLHAVFPEKFSNCEIREVGIYETVNGYDYLFAISTQQPLLKPSEELNYLVSVDYYAFLKSQNLADVYDQIILDPDNQLVTEEDLQNLMSTILFTESNLMEQINSNTRVIGLNRTQQLYEKIEENRRNFGYISAYNNFSTLLDYTEADNIFGYWIFNYPRRTSPEAAIIDISKEGRNFSCNKAINTYDREYTGFMPMLKFDSPNYFYLDKGMSLLNEDQTADVSFTMFFTLNPVTKGIKRTLLARSNYATNSHVFEVNETADNRLEVKLFADSSNYITFLSGEVIPEEAHSLVLCYRSDDKTMKAFINGKETVMNKVTTGTYEHMNTSLSTLYAFASTPTEVLYSNSATTPTELYNVSGAPYTGEEWNVLNNEVFYNGNKTFYTPDQNVSTELLYAWVYNDGLDDHIVYTKTQTIAQNTVLYEANYSEYKGTDFIIVPSGSQFVIQYSGNPTAYEQNKNIQPKTLYAYVYTGSMQIIWSNSNTSPVVLYSSNGDLYRGQDWTLVDGVIKYRNKYVASYSSQYNVTVPSLEVTSYVTSNTGTPTQLIDSYVGVVAVIKDELSSDELRAISLNLEATMGKNPCISVF